MIKLGAISANYESNFKLGTFYDATYIPTYNSM